MSTPVQTPNPSPAPAPAPAPAAAPLDINAPLDQLRAAAVPAAQPPTAPQPATQPTSSAPASGEPPSPAAPPAAPAPAEPELFSMTNNPDGTVQIKLMTGETFTGSPLDVAQKLAAAKVNTRLHYEGIAKAALAQQQPQQPAPPAQPAAPAVDPAQAQLQQFIADNVAQAMGFPDAATMKSYFGSVEQVTTDYQGRELAAQFHARCQDFPSTAEATASLEKVMEESGFDFRNVNHLEAAHTICLRRGLYQPVQPQRVAAPAPPSTMPTPPPMLNTQAPAAPAAQVNPYDLRVSAEQLREWALKSQ